MNEEIQYERYQRQLILKGFGVEAQRKLKAARVLVIGAGGLGCPIMQYLVAAGVGHIGIADHDTVSVSNLHRQILFGQEDVGRPKVEVVKQKMNRLNQDVIVETWQEKWTPSLCLAQFPLFDIIVDATDNFASRYMINDACVLLGKPLVFGAVSQFEGQVAVFNHLLDNGNRSVNYRDLFPEPPASGEVLNCAEGGVLGVLPGMIGAMQATEVIKLITGLGKPLVNRLWNYNALTQDVFVMQLVSNPLGAVHLPLSEDQFLKMDYDWLCSIPMAGIEEVDVYAWKQNHMTDLVVDIREPYEEPRLNELSKQLGFNLLEIPLSALESKMNDLSNQQVVFVCQAGRRSLQAVSIWLKTNREHKAFSLSGGVNALKQLNLI